MSISNRLTRLECYRLKLVYPSFSDLYATQAKQDYDQWLLDHNVGLTQDMIDELNIVHISEMYNEH